MSLDLIHPAVDSPRVAPVRRLSALPISVVVHILVVIALVVIPLLASDTLPKPAGGDIEYRDVVPVVPQPPPPRPTGPARAVPAAESNPDAAPAAVPDGIGRENGIERTPPADSGFRTDRGVVEGEAIGVGIGTVLNEAPPPAPVTKPIPVGGKIREPQRIVDVRPAYPETARLAKVQGLVIMEAVIGTDGSVQNVRVLRSQPLLDEAALAAVRQWRYTPTLLNGVPVPVIVTVTVNFTLQ